MPLFGGSTTSKQDLGGNESKPEPGPLKRSPGMSYLTIAIIMILVSTIFLLMTRNILQVWSRGLILSGLTIGIIYGFITLVKGHVGAATSILLLALAAVFSCFMMTDTGGNLTQPFFRTVLGVQLVPLGLELGGRSVSGLALTGVGLGFLVPNFTIPYSWLAVAVLLILIGILLRKGVFRIA